MAEPDLQTAAEPHQDAMPDAEGTVTAPFVEAVEEAVRTGDAERVRALAADLHEADLGELLEALDEELRPALIELLGDEFDFAALTEVDETRPRPDSSRSCRPKTVADGRRATSTPTTRSTSSRTSSTRTAGGDPRRSCRRSSASRSSAASTTRRSRPAV